MNGFTATEYQLLALYRRYTGMVESTFVNDRGSYNKNVYRGYIHAMSTIRSLTGITSVRPLEAAIQAYVNEIG
jgi:hypothetical protein